MREAPGSLNLLILILNARIPEMKAVSRPFFANLRLLQTTYLSVPCSLCRTAVLYLTGSLFCSLLLVKRDKLGLLREVDRLRSQIMLTSFGAGGSVITCACELVSGLLGGALSRLLCARSHVEGTEKI